MFDFFFLGVLRGLFRPFILFFTFLFSTFLGQSQILINEVMIDPTPQITPLINTEYIELKNVTNKTISLKNWHITDLKKAMTLPEITIKPEQIVLLHPKNAIINPALSKSTLRFALAQWLSINNDIEELLLSNENDEIIDSFSFNISNWKQTSYKNGGLSLELIDNSKACKGHYQVAPLSKGGTPGYSNTPTTIKQIDFSFSFDAKQPHQLGIRASHPIIEIKNISISSPTTESKPLISVDIIQKEDQTWLVSFEDPIPKGKYFDVSLNDIMICGIPNAFVFRKQLLFARPPGYQELIINELMFDPKPGEVEYLEIKNTTSDYLDLQDCRIVRSEPYLKTPYNFGDTVIPPKAYLVLTRSKERLINLYPEMDTTSILLSQKLPSLPNTGATLYISGSTGEFIDDIHYDQKSHHPYLKNTEGIALERLSDDQPIFYSANTLLGGTPGATNSHSNETAIPALEKNQITINPPLIHLGETRSIAKIDIALNQGQNKIKVFISAYDSVPIKTWTQEIIIGTTGHFPWDGTDNDGRNVISGRYIVTAIIEHEDGKTILLRDTIVIHNRQ